MVKVGFTCVHTLATMVHGSTKRCNWDDQSVLIYVKIITYNQGRVITDSTELVVLLYAMATLLHHLCGVWRFN